jgi:hypothetical protein
VLRFAPALSLLTSHFPPITNHDARRFAVPTHFGSHTSLSLEGVYRPTNPVQSADCFIFFVSIAAVVVRVIRITTRGIASKRDRCQNAETTIPATGKKRDRPLKSRRLLPH